MGKRGADILIGCLVMFVAASFAHAQVEIWEYYHDGPATGSDIVLGADNNVYAAGFIEDLNGKDFAIVSTDNAGIERWVVTLNGSANGDDEAKSVVYGGDGNVYVAGTIEDATGKDFVVASVTTSGDTNWTYRYDGPSSGNDVAQVVIYGGDGYVYAAGNSSGTGTANDLTIVKLSTSGNEEWVYRSDGSDSDADVLYDMVYGTDGNIYAAGYITETGEEKNFAVVSVDTDGNGRWPYTFNGTAGTSQDQARSIVYGLDGYVYAAGWVNNSGSGNDYTIVKLSTAGSEQWVCTSDTSGVDRMYSIDYGADNNLYVAGYVKGNNNDYAMACHDTAGNLQWRRQYNGSSQFQIPNDKANSIVYGGDGNVYATGFLQNENTSQDMFVVCCDNVGNEIWTYEKNMPANANDQGKKIIWGADDKLYIAGRLGGGNGRFGIVCIDPTAYPNVWVSPSSFYVQLYEGETTDRPLRLVNVGTGDMDWTISEKIGSDWLSVDDTTGSNLIPGDTASLTVTFDGTVVPPAHYYDTLVVTINNPYNPETEVSVHLWVKELGIEDYPFDMIEDKCQVISSFFTKQISLSFTKPSETACEIGIYNVLGMRVYHKSIPSTPSLVNLDDEKIAKLSNGIYFLSVSRIEKTYPVKKLIKY